MWLNITEYNPNDLCPICHDEYGTTQAIFKTPCNHIFHNNCLNQYCEHNNGNVVCPVCRRDIGYSCTDVWAFENKALGNPEGTPLFNNQHVYSIYNSQTTDGEERLLQGGKRKRTNKPKRKSRKLNKKKKQNKRKTNRKK